MSPRAFARQARAFAAIVFAGLLFGATVAALTAALLLLIVIVSAPSVASVFGAFLFAGVVAAFTVTLAVLLTLFPIGPAWALLAGLLYGNRVEWRWTYALAGAIAASTAPIVSLLSPALV